MKYIYFFIFIYLSTTIVPSLLIADENDRLKTKITNDMTSVENALINNAQKRLPDQKWQNVNDVLTRLEKIKEMLSQITDEEFKEYYKSIIEQKKSYAKKQITEIKEEAYISSKSLFEKGIDLLGKAKKEKRWEDRLDKAQRAIKIFEKLKNKENKDLYYSFEKDYKEPLMTNLENAKDLKNKIKTNNSSEYAKLIATSKKLFEKGKEALQNAEQATEKTKIIQKAQEAIDIFSTFKIPKKYNFFYEDNREVLNDSLKKATELKTTTIVNLPEYKNSEILFEEGGDLLKTAKEKAQQRDWVTSIDFAQEALYIFEQIKTEVIHQYFRDNKATEKKKSSPLSHLYPSYPSIVHEYEDKSRELISKLKLILDAEKDINNIEEKKDYADSLLQNEDWKEALNTYKLILQDYQEVIKKLKSRGDITSYYGEKEKQKLIDKTNSVKKQIEFIMLELAKEKPQEEI